MPKIKNKLWNFFSGGLPREYDIDVLSKMLLINFLLVFGATFLLVLGTIAIIQNDFALGAADYIILIFFFGMFIFVRKSKSYWKASLAGTIVTGCFYFYLIASGGVNNTAYVWMFTYPLLSLFLLGTKAGLILSLLLLASSCVVFIFGSRVTFFTTYDPNLIIRIIPSYIATIIFTFIMERTRRIVQTQLRESNTGLLKAVSELKDANKLKTELLNISAHDLKNPLNTIKSGADLLLSEQLEDDDKKQILKMISRSTDSMISIISDLLDSAEVEDTEFTLKLKEIDIGNIIQNVVHESEFKVKRKEQKITVWCPHGLQIIGDPDKLKIAFQNLIDNAVKYSPVASSISIIVADDSSNVCIEITDEGEGFSEEDKARAFRKFQRLSARPTAGESSTGLGLSIVKSIIELHNGSVWIESEKHKGSTIYISLRKKLRIEQ